MELEDLSTGLLFVNVDPPQKQGVAARGFLLVDADNAVVRYGSAVHGRQQDTLVFVEDPIAVWEGATNAELPPLTSPGVGVSWYGAPCSPNQRCTDSDASRKLACVDFYGVDDPRCQADVAGESVDETEAYFTYDRGACSHRTAMAGLLQKLCDTASQKMYDKVADADPGLASTESHQHAQAQTAIWQGSDGSAQGGFQLNLRMDVHTTGVTYSDFCGFDCWPIYVNYDADGNVNGRFRWAIQEDGVLGAEVVSTHTISASDDTDLYGIFNWSKPIAGDMIDGLKNDVPDDIHEEARSTQLAEIPNLSGKPVTCDAAADCVSNDAAATLVLAVQASDLVTKPQKSALVEIVHDPSEWVCEKNTEVGAKTCRILLRAKRVNVYPDSVELVFREAGGLPISRETVVELAAPEQMCDKPQHREKLIEHFQRKKKDRVYD